jgi:hypothetical protein
MLSTRLAILLSASASMTCCVRWDQSCPHGEVPDVPGACYTADGAVELADGAVVGLDSTADAATDAGPDADGGTATEDGGPKTDASADGGARDAEARDAGENDSGCGALPCGGCSANTDCPTDRPLCDAAGLCVQCLANKDCSQPDAPICQADGTCQATCRSDRECARDAWSEDYCNLRSGQCVECLPGALETSQCTNGRACDPGAFTCSGKTVGSVGVCEGCITDTECGVGLACVPTTFNGQPNGSFCLAVAGAAKCPEGMSERLTATSASNYSATYCFPNQTVTTCEAVQAFGRRTCSTNSDCGAAGLDDGYCATAAGGAKLCSYRCSRLVECGASSTCVTQVAEPYCTL